MATMDSERELAKIKEIVQENNKMLRNLQRRARFATVFHIVKWVVIILIAFGLYTIVQPIIIQFSETYNSLVDGAAAISEIKDSLPSTANIRNFFGN